MEGLIKTFYHNMNQKAMSGVVKIHNSQSIEEANMKYFNLAQDLNHHFTKTTKGVDKKDYKEYVKITEEFQKKLFDAKCKRVANIAGIKTVNINELMALPNKNMVYCRYGTVNMLPEPKTVIHANKEATDNCMETTVEFINACAIQLTNYQLGLLTKKQFRAKIEETKKDYLSKLEYLKETNDPLYMTMKKFIENFVLKAQELSFEPYRNEQDTVFKFLRTFKINCNNYFQEAVDCKRLTKQKLSELLSKVNTAYSYIYDEGKRFMNKGYDYVIGDLDPDLLNTNFQHLMNNIREEEMKSLCDLKLFTLDQSVDEIMLETESLLNKAHAKLSNMLEKQKWEFRDMIDSCQLKHEGHESEFKKLSNDTREHVTELYNDYFFNDVIEQYLNDELNQIMQLKDEYPEEEFNIDVLKDRKEKIKERFERF